MGLGESITIADFVEYCRCNKEINLDGRIIEQVTASADVVRASCMNKTIYGVNTGFGRLCTSKVDDADLEELQKNLVRSHSCGIGLPIDIEVSKGVLFLKTNSLAKGYSGITVGTLETLVEMFNKNVIPVMPEKGSLGASGDLVPLAHLALTMIGEGVVYYKGTIMKSGDALEEVGIKKVKFAPKEGLALVNGLEVSSAVAALCIYDTQRLSRIFDISSAMTIEALRGNMLSFSAKLQSLKPHSGQAKCAENIRRLVYGSKLLRDSYNNMQDPYSIRCIPQVHGAAKDGISYVWKTVETEINSVGDNPVIIDKELISSGNFHGEHIATAMDFLAINLTNLSGIAERRIDHLLNSSYYPRFLVKNAGLNSGFMIAQNIAVALIAENKVLSTPVSINSIPVSNNQEDYVSMSLTAAMKAKKVLENSRYIAAIELLLAAQALDFTKGIQLGSGTAKAHMAIRKLVSHLDKDRVLENDIKTVHDSLDMILDEVESAVGVLE